MAELTEVLVGGVLTILDAAAAIALGGIARDDNKAVHKVKHWYNRSDTRTLSCRKQTTAWYSQ